MVLAFFYALINKAHFKYYQSSNINKSSHLSTAMGYYSNQPKKAPNSHNSKPIKSSF